jgi:hypothetical protein
MVTMDALPASGAGDRATDFLTAARAGRLRAITDHHRALGDRVRIDADREQAEIDAELRASRRRALQLLRHQAKTDPLAVAGSEFLAVADEAGVLEGILTAAIISARPDACDLQLYHRPTRSLRLVAQRGFTAEFVARFQTVDADVPTACALALATRKPVVVDDLTTSPIFAGRPTLEVMLSAGSRAVQSYPLLDASGDVLGMLSFHYRLPRPRAGNQELIAAGAAVALADLATR